MAKICSKLNDSRIQAKNYLFEISIKTYVEIARKIIDKNEFQRKRVKNSSSVYSLLKDDLKIGCVVPPLTLAYSNDDEESKVNIEIEEDFFSDANNIDKLLILDGLQRTHTIIDICDEFNAKISTLCQITMNGNDSDLENTQKTYDDFLQQKIRVEVYFGLNRMAILYRMLTLNTGQTPMNIRHQVEIMYMSFIPKNTAIKLLKATDSGTSIFGKYKLSDIVDGFTSFIDKDESSIDRMDVLENINNLKDLINEDSSQKEMFSSFLDAYHEMLKKLIELSNDWKANERWLDSRKEKRSDLFDESRPESERPFGKNAERIFISSQACAGFGAAIGKLLDSKAIKSIDSAKSDTDKIKITDQIKTFDVLTENLSKIRTTAKRIGAAERAYFMMLFRELYNPTNEDTYLKFDEAVVKSFNKYKSQY